MIQCLFKNAKHCVVEILKISKWIALYLRLYRFELFEG